MAEVDDKSLNPKDPKDKYPELEQAPPSPAKSFVAEVLGLLGANIHLAEYLSSSPPQSES